MNILTLSIKQKYFDEILAGKKTHEYREIRPTNAKKYITYLCGGKEYPADAELPEEGEVELKPIKYDAIKLLTGAYTGKQLNTWLPQTTQQTEPELLGKPVNDKAPQPSTAPLGKPIEDKKQLTEKLSDALDALLHHSADTTEK